MEDAEEVRRRKARELRYRKPIVKNINLDFIREDLNDIACECEEVRYYVDEDDETLINALDGDEDEAYEFKMMFADLCAECERMQEDLYNRWENLIPEGFDSFFAAIGAGDTGGGLLGWDSYEGDYFGLQCTDSYAEDESAKKLKQMTKDNLIISAKQCFKIYHSYLGLRHRYDCLNGAMDILKSENTDYLKQIKAIEEAYMEADKVKFREWEKATRNFDRLISCLPQTAWLQ